MSSKPNLLPLMLIFIAISSQVSIAQTTKNGNATSPEKTVGSTEAAKEIRESTSNKPPVVHQTPENSRNPYTKPHTAPAGGVGDYWHKMR